MTNLKTYLNVPFAEKDAAKALGARWDPAKKKWYAPADKEVSDFSKWHSAVNTKRPSEKKTKPEGITTYAKDKDFVAYNGELPPLGLINTIKRKQMNSRQFQIAISALFSVFLFSSVVQSADLELGKKLAPTCLHCHGSDGNSKKPLTPSLAGQRPLYIESQITAYQSERRESPVMKNMVAKLNKKEIRSLSHYLASLTPESAGADEILAKKGQAKFAVCTGCHGASAKGRSGYPRLAGQQSEYLEKQLLDFKSGFRQGGMMNSITRSLSEQDIKEITAYLARL